MSWTEAEPVVKIVHSVKAGIDIDVSGRAKLNLSFSEPFMMEMGSPKTLVIQAGSGENLGKIRIVPDAKGAFKVREYDRGGGRVQILLPEGITKRNRDLEPCEVLSRPTQSQDVARVALPEGSAWVVQLPQAAWDKQVQAPPAPKPPAPQAPAPSAAHTSTRPINAAEYLKKKGVRCAKMAGDWWQLEGSRAPRIEVLGRVNEFRRRDDLPSLGIDNIE